MYNMKTRTLITTIITLITACITVQNAMAQTDKQQVEAALMDYIDGFYTGDTSKISRSISRQVNKYGFYKASASRNYEGMSMPFNEMIDYCLQVKAQNKAPNPSWPKKAEVYDVQDKTAVGKVTAWWGTDYITLAKVEGKWMIQQVLWQSGGK
jgi:Putative lumazine-binding